MVGSPGRPPDLSRSAPPLTTTTESSNDSRAKPQHAAREISINETRGDRQRDVETNLPRQPTVTPSDHLPDDYKQTLFKYTANIQAFAHLDICARTYEQYERDYNRHLSEDNKKQVTHQKPSNPDAQSKLDTPIRQYERETPPLAERENTTTPTPYISSGNLPSVTDAQLSDIKMISTEYLYTISDEIYHDDPFFVSPQISFRSQKHENFTTAIKLTTQVENSTINTIATKLGPRNPLVKSQCPSLEKIPPQPERLQANINEPKTREEQKKSMSVRIS